MPAKEKIVNEMNSFNDKTANRETLEVIGEYVLDYIDKNGESGIQMEGKTLKGALDTMRDYASKNRKGNMVCIAPDKGFEIIREYFGINAKRSITADVDDLFA